MRVCVCVCVCACVHACVRACVRACMHACIVYVYNVYNIKLSVFIHDSSSCTFEGSHDELSTHLQTCSYEKLKGFLGRTDDHILQLQDELKKKDEV